MEVMIANALASPIHVAVVRYSSVAIEFLISPTRVPIPCGTVLRREDLAPDHALVMTGFDEETEFSAMFDGYLGTIRAVLMQGKKEDGPFWRLTLLSHSEAG
ncbi:MAG TPA: hypothetical protein VLC10_04005 [Patescibacteria group bacterium]|nr:hypothetical protein [Patescibacteria group bacterium]